MSESDNPYPLRATIVIATRDRQHDIMACLASLDPEALAAREVEIIVVDDASEDDTVAVIGEFFPAVHILRNHLPRGASFSRNRGSREALGKLLLYLDSDGEVAPGWIDAMLDHDDGETVLLGNVVDHASGRVQGVPRRATFIGKSLRCRPARANTGPSCNLGFPHAVFERIGGFDHDLPYYFEDSDLCIRARMAGARFCFVEEAVFRHKGSERKRGQAIRLQEEHSTLAMLKNYADRPWVRRAFSLLNGMWLFTRLILWGLRGRFGDARRLWRGWRNAYRRFNDHTA
ncbi:MAG: glycosyltransferase [Candidatus Hydrogenedentes bacterium]|nr:glycosyltransferase [Candidatus Hydrogenedentota bacterium]